MRWDGTGLHTCVVDQGVQTPDTVLDRIEDRLNGRVAFDVELGGFHCAEGVGTFPAECLDSLLASLW